MSRLIRWVAVVAVVTTVGGCSIFSESADTPKWTPAHPRTAMPAEAVTVLAETGAVELAIAVSKAIYQHAPAIVVVGQDDAASLPEAADKAIDLGVPVLLAPSGDGGLSDQVRQEMTRLAPRAVVTVGDAATAWVQTAAPSAAPSVVPGVNENVALSGITPSEPLDELLVLGLDAPAGQAAAATARAAGARLITMSSPDPRRSDKSIKALTGQSFDHVLALGAGFGPAERLRARLEVAATGVVLPGGGQVVFPGRRMIALYGHPGDSVLGVLGEQGVQAAIARAKRVASDYEDLVDEPVVPTFEVIATVASAGKGSDGNYSNESSLAHLRPWINAAKEAGVYVVLDLQPGLTDFTTQAKLYEEFLKQPHVGLALDPEWRLKPGQKHMVQIGSVDASEVNETAAWLAQLTRENKLPQKVLMLHQFRLDMITNRSTLDTSHDELSIVIHADGFGSHGQKFNTWNFLRKSPPPNITWGWKNFYDEDTPTFTPAETMAIKPSPVFISYQ